MGTPAPLLEFETRSCTRTASRRALPSMRYSTPIAAIADFTSPRARLSCEASLARQGSMTVKKASSPTASATSAAAKAAIFRRIGTLRIVLGRASNGRPPLRKIVDLRKTFLQGALPRGDPAGDPEEARAGPGAARALRLPSRCAAGGAGAEDVARRAGLRAGRPENPAQGLQPGAGLGRP